ncbi:hypothetical protein [Variovorax sp. YR566]|uniref:hypothetical protein n=1 Tax=Variovorax sp. YR566 TaxID=3450237 RepID=UPI003F7F1EFE
MTEYSVPIPKNFRETDDWFTSVFVGAPDFVFLNSCVTYKITLDMMMDALRQGIADAARRTKNKEAEAIFRNCIEEVNSVHGLYRDGMIAEAQKKIQETQLLFQKAGKLRSSKSASS